MDKRLEDIFLYEIIFQCKTILSTFEMLSKSLDEDIWNNNLIWGLLSLILTSTSNISKIFWPSDQSGKSCLERGEYLRNLLQINDDSVIYNRDLRNNFEHFDERLHRWYKNSKTKNFSYRNINITIRNDGSDDYMDMGNYDSRTNTVTFWNIIYELDPIKMAITDLLYTTGKKCNERVSKS
ncbi:MAG: hypothetical protein L0H53_08850 [Candidatus Nitrosocosmicus sp.]|nr:hypothetical protein [Candidatus Nitrosocosmicus sp.]MDN5868641.1 hypothetical protein [Candidatus Nitrosocosmicus sp.]